MGDFKGASALRVGNARAWNPVVDTHALHVSSSRVLVLPGGNDPNRIRFRFLQNGISYMGFHDRKSSGDERVLKPRFVKSIQKTGAFPP